MTLRTLKDSLQFISDDSLAAENLWNTFGSLNVIYQTSQTHLLQVSGVSEQVADYIVSQSDLFSHLAEEQLVQSPIVLHSLASVRGFLKYQIAFRQRETFLVIFLDIRNRVLDWKILFEGGLNSTFVDVAVVAREALIINAKGVIVAHNHPSNSCNPSNEDLAVTTQLINALNLLNISLLDHLVVASRSSTSIREQNPNLFS